MENRTKEQQELFDKVQAEIQDNMKKTAELKASATAKLVALGLTEEEVKSL